MHYDDVNAIAEIFIFFGMWGCIIAPFRGAFPYIGVGLLAIGFVLYVVALAWVFKESK